MKNTLFLLVLCIMTFVWASSAKVDQSSNKFCQPKDFAELKTFLRYNPQQNTPFIMAHRGGPVDGFPENCLATFKRTLQQIRCPLMEFDVRMSVDSVLVLGHDDVLEHASNGTGSISKSSWKALQKLFLKDQKDLLTPHRIPSFTQTLHFFKSKPCILIIDNKPGTPIDLVLMAISKAKVEPKSVLICYSLKDAEYVYRKKPDLMLALGFNQEAQIAAIEKSTIPKDQLVALTPREIQPTSYYERIHALGISCSLGTNGNIDTLPLADSKAMYWERFKAGADIICTDRPVEVARFFDPNKQ